MMVDGQPVRATVTLANGRVETCPGNIVFVSPIVDAGPQFLVWAEVVNRQDNGHWLLRPGLNAEMSIELKK